MNWKQILLDVLASGMTQREIAEAIGVTQSAISQVINDADGRRGFRFEPGQRLVELHAGRGQQREGATA
ncbi:helix-turn-helix domain-containing protein [Ralstonia mannitolilytica]|uniref:helix-turn-helix domain-containing protein n=1 Tax=Ralstonia mannitolilytica TaxID=105219 RepID=UPI000C79A203|nr:helix-turn-helix transcriptional regulator [Ralstonia mannitolilytica]PLT18712.1 hypothetical protein CXP34_01525 [Ralstonia mannitolilytica]